MADDRLKKLALRWGAIALAVQIYVALDMVADCVDDWSRTLFRSPPHRLMDRMSQLMPGPFKFPWVAVYMTAYALVGIAIVAFLIYFGVREARDDRE